MALAKIDHWGGACSCIHEPGWNYCHKSNALATVHAETSGIIVMGPSTWWKEIITANGKWGSCIAMQVTEARWCESKVSLVGYLEGRRIRGCHRDRPKYVSETGVELPTRRLKQNKTRQARPKVMTDNSWTFRVLLPCTCRCSRGSTRSPRRRCPHSQATP